MSSGKFRKQARFNRAPQGVNRQYEAKSNGAANDLNHRQYEAKFRRESRTNLPHGVTHNLPYRQPEPSPVNDPYGFAY